MDCSTPGFPVLHHVPELAQTHVHQVSDAIQPFHPLSSPSPPAPNPFVSLGRFIPKYFILFITLVNGIVSLISLSVFSLLVYRNARDFWYQFYILQLYYIR